MEVQWLFPRSGLLIHEEDASGTPVNGLITVIKVKVLPVPN
jgi:hypothetical protein